MRKNTPKIYIICGLVLALGVILSAILYTILLNSDKSEREKLVSDNFNNIHNRIKNEIDKNINTLYALKAYYLAHNGFSRKEFGDFSSYYTDNIKSIQALEWVPYVTHTKRDSFELTTQQEGFENFEIHVVDSHGVGGKGFLSGQPNGVKAGHVNLLHGIHGLRWRG